MGLERESYWKTSGPARLSRRRLLYAGTAPISALAAGPLLGCSSRGRASGGGTSGGPAGQASAGAPQPGGTFVNALTFNNVLDAHKASNDHTVVSPVQSRLFRFKTGLDPKTGTNHDLENELGISVESPDAVTWTVKMRPDAKFFEIAPVNGHPVEAEDVKATFTRAVDPATASPNRGALSFIDPAQIQTPDRFTLVFKLNYAYAPFAHALASPVTSWIFPREVLSGGYDPAKTVIGSGPFMLDSAEPDVAYTYKRNPDYFEKPLPYVDGMKTAIIPDTHQQEAQFVAGNLDMLSAPIVDLDTIRQQNPKAATFEASSATPSPLYPQEGDPSGPFYDIRVRRAVSMVIDRDALSKALLNGMGVGVAFVPLYLGKWAMLLSDLPKGIQQWYQYNPGDAKKLLDVAGWSNLTLRLGYVTNGPFSTAAYNKLAETVNGMFNQAGIKSSLVTQDYNTQYIGGGHGSRQGFFDKDMIILAGVGSVSDADAALFDNFSSKSTSNGDHLSDPVLDGMIDRERATVNEDDRLKVAQDIERYIADKAYVIPTEGSNTWWFLNSRIKNFQYASEQGFGTETYAKLWIAK